MRSCPGPQMIPFFFAGVVVPPTAWWGWLAMVTLGAVILLPYLYRGASAENTNSQAIFIRPPSLHFWLGPAVFLVSFIHAWVSMGPDTMAHTRMYGLWLATYALGLLFLQVILGVVLRWKWARIAVLRRAHFVVMLGIEVLVLSHLWLNWPRI